MPTRCCFIIPIYNHHHKLAQLLDAIVPFNLPIFLIDDGSDEPSKSSIQKIVNDALVQQAKAKIELKRLEQNHGKGAAVMCGFSLAHRQKMTHAIQIDADFQHDIKDVEKFRQLSKLNPKALICGVPIYDESVPKGRLYPRYITHFWVWIHTLSFAIKDSMCGYRLYPLATTIELIKKNKIAKRMNFDTDIIVRLKWNNVPIINCPTKVIYHDDVPSNFKLFKDNIGITWMHTVLFFGMLKRLPRIIKYKFSS